MMKKTLLSIALFTIMVSFAGCGGSGSGTSSEPIGVNPGIPSVVQLLPLQIVAQTNSYIDFRAKVLDGNGNPVKNEPVTFTNLSLVGTLQPPPWLTTANGVGISAGGPVVVNTDSLGFATITLYSTTFGFATVQAEVNAGLGQVRDSKTILFITGSLNLLPDLTLDVDGDVINGIFNEASDFIFFETTTDDTVQVRATVYDRFGRLVSGSIVTFGADISYRIGPDPEATCSDGSDACEVFFMFGNTAITNSSGQASVFVKLISPALRNVQTLFNVTAVADNWAADLVTLFVQPVTVALVTVSANPVTVECGGTSTITARVTTSGGTLVPDGTSVSFTVDIGSIEPFAQTTDGIAEVKYTAPDCDPGDADQVATITATVAGISGTTTVTVTAEPLDPIALSVQPSTQTIDSTSTVLTATFTILNGTPGYSIFSSDPAHPPSVATVAASGGTFSRTVPGDTPATTVTYTIIDAVGGTVTATLTITGPGALAVSPSAVTASCGLIDQNFTVIGGVAPYTATSLNPKVVISNSPVGASGGFFTGTTVACAGGVGDTIVDITVDDSDAPASQVIVKFTVQDP